ncbi:hypothetical protein ACLKA6_019596 [Drosophila palustris]
MQQVSRNNKKIPVPDPGVPALPETDTFLRLPQVGPQTDLLFTCWPTFLPPPYINKLTGHFKFRYVHLYIVLLQQWLANGQTRNNTTGT